MLSLSSKRLGACVPFEDPDFSFLVGNVEYKCCRFQACFVSERVCRLITCDRTVNQFRISTEDQDQMFRCIVDLMNGTPIEVNASNIDFLTRVAQELENEEILSYIAGIEFQEKPTLGNVVERLHMKRVMSRDLNTEIAFIAANFYQLPSSVVSALDFDDFEMVLAHPALKLGSEDQLFEILSRAITADKRYLQLLRLVHFQHLCLDNLRLFLDLAFPDLIDKSLWDEISKYMMQQRASKRSSMEALNRYPVQCTTEGANQMDVFQLLRQKHRTKILGYDVVAVTASSTSFGMCRDVLDPDNVQDWRSGYESSPFLAIEFKDIAVRVTGYRIKTGHYGFPRSWVIEASQDGSEGSWEVIDSKTTNLNRSNTFSELFVCRAPSRFYPHIRIRQTGKNAFGTDCFTLSGIALYGDVV